MVILAATLSAVPLAVQAGDGAVAHNNEIEVRGFSRGDPTLRAYFEKSITDKVALNLSAFKMPGWDEVTLGATYYVTPEMSLGAGFGASRYAATAENTKSAHNAASAFRYGKTDASEAELLVERYQRDPTPWYREGYVQKRINDSLSVGLLAKTDSGWGRASTAPSTGI